MGQNLVKSALVTILSLALFPGLIDASEIQVLLKPKLWERVVKEREILSSSTLEELKSPKGQSEFRFYAAALNRRKNCFF